MTAERLIPIGTLTPGVGRCWLVDICHEDGPVGEAWRQAYTSLRRAKGDVITAYADTHTIRFSAMGTSGGWLVYAVDDG